MKAAKFKTFLKNSGAEILEPTNPYEVVRFRTKHGVSVMYEGKKGYSFTGEAKEAYEAMKKKNVWSSTPQGHRKRKKVTALILERDGVDCFYCGKETDDQTRSLEHILSVADGGNNDPANLAIACKSCNLAVGNMPIIEKIKYRETIRG